MVKMMRFKNQKSNNVNFEKVNNNPWRVVLFYIIFGSLWIYGSDRILGILVRDITTYDAIQTMKGWLFIIVTAVLLYFTIKIEYYKRIHLFNIIVEKNDELSGFNEEFIAINNELEDKVTTLNHLTMDLGNQKQFYQNIYNSANVVMFSWKLDGTIIEINSYFEELLGFGEEVIGKNWEDIIIKNPDNTLVNNIIGQLQNVPHLTNVEEINIDSNGNELHMLWNDALIYDYKQEQNVVVSFGVNITNERLKDRELFKLAYSDILTNLGNLAAFEIECNEKIRDNTPFALIIVDIDNFKQVNNVYDHFVGDEFLKRFSSELVQVFDRYKIFRWFGDEFILVGTFEDYNLLHDDLKKIILFTNQSWSLEKIEYKPTACIGVATYPKDASSSMELFKNAEIALFDAKQKGISQVTLFSSNLLNKVIEDEEMTRKIDDGLRNNLFSLRLQPIFSMADNRIKGAEILIRLEDGRINTQTMINHAELTGQILQIDRWVICESFRFVKEYVQDKNDLKISVNLSTKTFNAFDLISFLKDQLEVFQIDAKYIQFEITEYTFINDLKHAKQIMHQLKSLGFLIALDDFGTKYSSLNYLKEIPLDLLKIDKSYIDHICDNEKDKKIVNHIISLAKSIGLSVVAEGIEVECQRDMLKEMKCDLVQGYLYSRPIIIDEFLKCIN